MLHVKYTTQATSEGKEELKALMSLVTNLTPTVLEAQRDMVLFSLATQIHQPMRK